jgi:hypothetical protein
VHNNKHRLSQRFLLSNRLAAAAVLVFVASPASIHHSLLYTEALFTAASWGGLYALYCRGSSLGAAFAFALSAAVRSNGALWCVGGRLRVGSAAFICCSLCVAPRVTPTAACTHHACQRAAVSHTHRAAECGLPDA